MAYSYKELIEEILSNVRGFTAAPDQLTSLKLALTASELTLTPDDATVLSAGTVEIGDELLWVKSVDSTAGTATVLPQGRGWAGTTAAAHSVGDTVVVAPTLPRSRVKRAINDAITSLWPTLFAVTTTTFTYSDQQKAAWSIPADAEMILDVRYKDNLDNWQRVRQWEVEHSMPTADFTNGKALRITQQFLINQTVQVVYGKRPTALSAETDQFTASGLTEGVKDLVVLAVLARLLPMLDVARLSVSHAPADELDQPRPLGSAISIADKFRAQYEKRLELEQRTLQLLYPARVHFTR